jgi:SAM-dependent methyltransferase
MDQNQLRVPDRYGRTHQMDQQALAAIAARLEARGKHPFFLRVIDDYVDALGSAGAEARRSEVKGAITAIDISADLIETGKRLAAEEGLGARIRFLTGDAHDLGLAEGEFDVVVMHTLISHVADPVTVLAEGRRLLRPGGRLVVFDGDYASFTMATDAPDEGAETDRILQGAIFSQLRVMRSMPRFLANQGFELQWSRAYVAADVGRADFWAPSLASFRVLLPRTGVMSGTEANAFIDQLEYASAENRFFGASNFYTYIARK